MTVPATAAPSGLMGRLGSADPQWWTRAWFDLVRWTALIVTAVGGLLFLFDLLMALFSLPRGLPGFGPTAIYLLITIVVNGLIWRSSRSWEERLRERGAPDTKETLLLWSVLGLVFGLFAGLVLLGLFLRAEGVLGPSPPPRPPPPDGTHTASATFPPPPASWSESAAPALPRAPPPDTLSCPRCGAATQFMPTPGRYFCPRCGTYL